MIRFNNVLAYVHNALADRKGVTALEYGVIAAGIVLIVAAAVTLLGPQLTTMFAAVGAAL
ncbi:MAG: Flp family type IVb pilin [Geminicoccaceae bacterium]